MRGRPGSTLVTFLTALEIQNTKERKKKKKRTMRAAEEMKFC